jgi:hypothetical protein
MNNNICKVLCVLTALVLATFALPASANGFPKPYKVQISVPPGQTTAPFTIQAKITNESLLPIQSLNLFVSGVTIVGVSNAVDTFQFFPHFSLPLPGFAKLAFTGSSISITRDPMFWGETLTLTIAVNSCGDAQWSPVAWTGSQLNGQTFNIDANSILASSIGCGPPLAAGAEFTVPDSVNPSCVTGMRGYYDKDGSVPVSPLPIFVTNTVPTNGQLHFRWTDFQAGGDPLATFEYDVCAPGPLPEVPNTQVAWLNTDGSPASTAGTPAYITAQDCLLPDLLPAPYGTLAANLGLTDTTVAVNTATPPPQATPGTPPGSISYPPGSSPTSPAAPGTPFDIVLGTERITVQLVCLDNDNDATDGNDCTETGEGEGKALMVVHRGVGGTAAATHSSGALVMSTPLPLLPANVPAPYVAGNQALMCVADQFTEGSGHATTFIDIGGDGWGSHP